MDATEIIQRFFFNQVKQQHFIPGARFEDAEYSTSAAVQDAFFKSATLTSNLLDELAKWGYVVRQRYLEPVE